MSASDHEYNSKERQAGMDLLRLRARRGSHIAAQSLNMDALARRIAGDAFVDESEDFSDVENEA